MGIFDHRQQELDRRSRVEGVTLADVIELPEPWRTAMNRMMRADSMTLNGLSAELSLNATGTRQIAETLVEKGFLSSMEREADGEIVYQVRLACTRGRSVSSDIWKALDQSSKGEP